MKTEELITNRECCGCRLCEEGCPKKAIHMVKGELGILYPQIDSDKCVNCHLCLKVCPAHKELRNSTEAIFAAINTQKADLLSSASGGVFSAIAHTVLHRSGVVYGAAMVADAEAILKVRHIRVETKEPLHLLQGSKYVQSDMKGIYSQIKADIKSGRLVLFSGTPCQVAAVKSFCGSADNLILAEIICHGVPSQALFSDYLNTLQRTDKPIAGFIFRTKESGWGMCASLLRKDANGNIRKIRIPCNISSYYKMFLHCETYRPSCYQCQYATQERIGDLTLGDYWGVQKDTEIFGKIKESGYEITDGISCVIASSHKGLDLLQRSDLTLIPTTFESIARENGQLTHPSSCPESRESIEALYREKGYAGLEEQFNKALGIQKYVILLRNRIPPKIRMKIRILLGK